jgi:ABC-type sugar transport system permease subunit
MLPNTMNITLMIVIERGRLFNLIVVVSDGGPDAWTRALCKRSSSHGVQGYAETSAKQP